MPRIANAQDRRVAVNVNLTVGMLDRLDRVAEAAGVSRSAFLREAVERALEDAEDVAVSIARLQDPNEPRIPWAQVKAEAGL